MKPRSLRMTPRSLRIKPGIKTREPRKDIQDKGKSQQSIHVGDNKLFLQE